MGFELQRKNMVNNQLMPVGISWPGVIDAFLKIPREKFVPRHFMHVAYMDDECPLMQGRILLRPSILGYLLQAIRPTSQDKVLYIGGSSGYGPALLSTCVEFVTSIESCQDLSQLGEETCAELGIKNIEIIKDDFIHGCKTYAPYDVLVIEGKVDIIPENLLDQLCEEGRGVAIMQKTGKSSRVVFFKKNKGKVDYQDLEQGHGPFLPGLEPKKEFVFLPRKRKLISNV